MGPDCRYAIIDIDNWPTLTQQANFWAESRDFISLFFWQIVLHYHEMISESDSGADYLKRFQT